MIGRACTAIADISTATVAFEKCILGVCYMCETREEAQEVVMFSGMTSVSAG